MKAFKVFVFGLLYGVFFKYAIDRIYRGNDMEDLQHENASLQEYIRTLESNLQARRSEPERVAPPSAQPAPSASQKDNLKVIKGIGPAIEKKLNGAGIYTFAALARLSVQELEGILGNASRLAQEGNLIEQARQLAQQR